jgi:hypothetical protein
MGVMSSSIELQYAVLYVHVYVVGVPNLENIKVKHVVAARPSRQKNSNSKSKKKTYRLAYGFHFIAQSTTLMSTFFKLFLQT